LLQDLRTWLFVNFVFCRESTHLHLDATHYFDTAINMVEEAVKKGWHQHFLFAGAVVDLVIQTSLAWYIDYRALVPIAGMVPVIALSIVVKQKRFAQLLYRRQQAENGWIRQMSDAMGGWMLINAYSIRGARVQRFKQVGVLAPVGYYCAMYALLLPPAFALPLHPPSFVIISSFSSVSLSSSSSSSSASPSSTATPPPLPLLPSLSSPPSSPPSPPLPPPPLQPQGL
jgi:hypothetical protein